MVVGGWAGGGWGEEGRPGGGEEEEEEEEEDTASSSSCCCGHGWLGAAVGDFSGWWTTLVAAEFDACALGLRGGGRGRQEEGMLPLTASSSACLRGWIEEQRG